MSFRYYDEALLEKIKNWSGPKLSISGPDDKKSLWMKNADEAQSDQITLPMLGLSRNSTIKIISTKKKPLTRDGFKYKYGSDSIEQLNGVPIELSYQLDIYTRRRAENDDIVREFIFKIINNPKLTIEIVYKNSRITHDCNVRLNEDISDNSDIPEHLINGEFFRTTLGLNIDDAYLFDYRVKSPLGLEIEYDDGSGTNTIIEKEMTHHIDEENN